MCGIAGFNFADRELIQRMTDAMRHRGPDDEGHFVDDRVSLGHRRLAILDTSRRGHQPMHLEHLAVVFNGEIYNYRELRDALAGAGYTFTTGTDTEVLLAAYHKWGPECVTRFNGMWAMAVYDSRAGTLLLSRDRFGIKPLYYRFDGERFAFASELNALAIIAGDDARIDPAGANFFFYQHYIGGRGTIWRDCFRLAPSENLLFDLHRRTITQNRYFDLAAEIAAQQARPLRDRLEEVEPLIVDAVRSRLIADVPVGSFLSGGLDSSLISAVIAKDRSDFDTFSVGFVQASYDEVPFSRRAAEHIHTDHHVEYLEMDDGLIDKVLSSTGEPFGDSSILPTYLLSRMTRQHVTVALSGDAGDEVFGGYDTYKAWKIARHSPAWMVRSSRWLIDRLPPSDRKVAMSFKMKRFVRDFGAGPVRRHLDWMATFNDPMRRVLMGEAFLPADDLLRCPEGNNLLAVQLADIHHYLAEDILQKVDAASMLNSLEARVPFLDHRLVPLVLSLPDRLKVRRLTTKWLLKRVARKWLPREIIHRAKRGFTVPVGEWVRKSELIREYLAGRCYYQHGLADYDHVQALLADHDARRQDNARQLWMVFVFNHWMEANACRWRKANEGRHAH